MLQPITRCHHAQGCMCPRPASCELRAACKCCWGLHVVLCLSACMRRAACSRVVTAAAPPAEAVAQASVPAWTWQPASWQGLWPWGSEQVSQLGVDGCPHALGRVSVSMTEWKQSRGTCPLQR